MSTPTSRPVRLEEIARHAGVSRSTVSIVLRGRGKERKISKETITRVRDSAERLNYVPNHMARSLRLQRSGMVGVLVSNLRADWAESVMGGMLDVFGPSGYTPFVAIHRFDAELAHRQLLSCLQRRDEGIICQPMPAEAELYALIRRSGVPLIFLGDRPADLPEVNFVGWDSSAAARVAVEHLVQTGRKRIAFVGVDYPMEMTRGRVRAYLDVLHEAGLPVKDEWIANTPIEWSPERILDWSFERLLADDSEYPDAIFALNDGIALLLLDALEARGVRVPEDLALIGMGDLPMTGHRGIGLSTVKEPCEEMGRQAAEVMLDLIANPKKAPIHRLIPGKELKVRRTTQ